jgi:carboxypeptidase Ss1
LPTAISSDSLLREVKKFEPEIIAIRRKIHENPELSYQEFETAKLVEEKLRSLGIKVRSHVGGTGVIGLLEGGQSGKVVALRADMDALPVQENVELPFKSKNDGVMHACGHDSHVAMLLGAAMLLSERKEDLKGTVKFLFQPAEEHGGRGGAKPMIEDGAMKNPKVDYVFGLHIGITAFPAGTFSLCSGPILAAPDSFNIRIIGKGGHGSEPENTIDPIFVASEVISAIQGITSRMIDQKKPFVISVCTIHAGTKDNIIPDDALLSGTIRTLDEQTRRKAKQLFRKVVMQTCRTFGARAEVKLMEDAYPVTVNDEKATERVTSILKQIKGTKTRKEEPILGGEDFSRFLLEAPGAFYFLSTFNKKKGCTSPNHSSKFKIDEDVLKYGAVSLASIASDFAAS